MIQSVSRIVEKLRAEPLFLGLSSGEDVLVSDWAFTASILESDVPLDTCR